LLSALEFLQKDDLIDLIGLTIVLKEEKDRLQLMVNCMSWQSWRQGQN